MLNDSFTELKELKINKKSIFIIAFTAILIFIGNAVVTAQTQFSEFTKLSYAAGNSTDFFGNSLAIDGNTIIIGASEFDLTATPNTRNGAAFIYVRQSNGAWTLQQGLFPGAGSNDFKFGNSVDISGDTAIVCAPGDKAAYIFVRNDGNWAQQARLTNASNIGFGLKCAISGNTVIATSRPDAGGGEGAVDVFVRSGTTWMRQAQLTRLTGSDGFFGEYLTIEGNTVVVGIPNDNNFRGSVQVFVRSGTTWTAQQRILASDGLSGNLFGSSVSVSGDTLVAGAPQANVPNALNEGAAYVFTRTGGIWAEQQKLISGDARPQAQFGSSVAVENNTAVVGSTRNNPINGFEGGAGYVFQRSGTVWTRTQRLLPADNHGDRFGWSADINGSNIIIGAIQDVLGTNGEQGSAYVFTAIPATCTYSLSPTRSGLFPASGGAGDFTVTTQAGCQWQATVQDRVTWTTTTSAGTVSGTVNFTVAANAGKPRRAEISINGQQIYTINQAAGQAAQQGDFDQTFANTGFTTTRVFNTNATRGVKVQPDGKVVVVGGSFGSAGDAAQILRYNADGSLDTTFDGDGIVTTAIEISSNTFADVVIQPDGKIVAAGSAAPVSADSNFVVVRYNSNGSLDTTFGTGGIVRTDFGSTTEGASAVGLTPDGKIFIAGTTANNTFGVARYNSNGSLDTTFDVDGKAIVPNVFFGVSDAAIQPDGKIVGMAGWGGVSVFLRFNTNGSLDTTFDVDGRVEIPNSTIRQVRTIAVQPDGKILGAGTIFDSGSGTTMIAVVRLNSNGSLDTTFDSDGIVLSNDFITALPRDIALQSNGKILVVGSTVTQNPYGTDSIIYRFNANGSLDTTFSGDGKIITGEDPTFQDAFDQSNALAIAPDGKIVVVGDYRFRVGQQDVMVLRFLGEGLTNARTPFDFDGDGKADIAVFRPSSGSWYLLQSQAGFTGFGFGLGTDKLAPADYDGDGKTDAAVVRNGTWYLLRSSQGFTGITFGDGNDIPVPADYDGDGKADIAVFRPSNGYWYLLRSSLGFTGEPFGVSTDKPVPADYDGDGKADIAVYRDGNWYLNRSSLGFTGIQFGDGNDKPVPADYDGDGKTDIAVFRPSNGSWYLLQSTAGFTGLAFGISTDLPAAADYDGDGKTDIAVYRSGNWYLQRSTSGFTGIPFGAAEDKPAPNAFIR